MSDSTSSGEPLRKRGRWRYGAPAAFLAISIVFYFAWLAVSYVGARSALDVQEQRILDADEPLRFSDLGENLPEESLAIGDRMMVLREQMEPLSNEFTALIDADPPTPPGDYAEFRRAIDANRSALEEIVDLSRRGAPSYRFDYQVKNPLGIWLDHIQPVEKACKILRAEALQSLGTGDRTRAVAALVDALDVTGLLRDDPFTVSMIHRGRYADGVLDSLQTVLPYVELTKDEFEAMDNRLASIEARFRMADVLRAERATGFTVMENLGSEEVGYFLQWLHSLSGDSWKGTLENRWWGSVFYRPRVLREQAFLLERMSEFIELVDEPGPEAQGELDALWTRVEHELEDRPVSSILFPAVPAIRTVGMMHRQRLIAARLGLRVDRYYARHRECPKSLESVLDRGLRNLPVGLFTGKPLSYVPETNGFAVFDETPSEEESFAGFEVDYSNSTKQPLGE